MSTDQPLRYTDPETVLSPKGSVANLHVLLNTGEGGWAVASMQWEGNDSLGIRWNGHADNPIGNPQSRGIATWFILPDELAALLRARFGDTLGGLSDQNTDITRVRIRPLPHRIWKGAAQEQVDYEWVLSITDRERGHMEIMNPSTGHFMALHRSQIKKLVRDSVNDKPSGPKHGILELNVQMIFEDGRLRLEPLQSLTDRIDEMFLELRQSGYDGKHERVRALIQEARTSLARETGELGPWEAHCLDYAETAMGDNFLRLALNEIKQAIAVKRLPEHEYERGYNRTTQKSQAANGGGSKSGRR
jgi:hypothetical protein